MGQFHIGQKIWGSKTRLRQPPVKGSHPCPGLELGDLKVECGRAISGNKFLCSVCADALRAWAIEHKPAPEPSNQNPAPLEVAV
jgi:hypothetical protein